MQGSQCAHSYLKICVCAGQKNEPTTCRVSACGLYGCVRATFRYSTCASPGCVHCIVRCGWILRRGCMQICNPKITFQSVAVNANGWPSSGVASFSSLNCSSHSPGGIKRESRKRKWYRVWGSYTGLDTNSNCISKDRETKSEFLLEHEYSNFEPEHRTRFCDSSNSQCWTRQRDRTVSEKAETPLKQENKTGGFA